MRRSPFMRSRRSVPCPASRKKLPEDAWFLLTKRLFCEKTSLVYDSLSSLRPEKRFEHLPFPEEIVRHVPNPAGWGTGMEDCMLNAGSVLEICILRARVELEQQQETLAFARRILDGMEACATVHGRPEFLPGMESPVTSTPPAISLRCLCMAYGGFFIASSRGRGSVTESAVC